MTDIAAERRAVCSLPYGIRPSQGKAIVVDARAAGTLWRAVRDLPLFGLPGVNESLEDLYF